MTSRLPCRPCATRTYRDRVIEARFDDLTGAEPSFRLVGPAGVLEARRPDEVPGVLAAAEAAAARGLWVAGFVAYEAAPGLDPALAVACPAAAVRSPTCRSRGSRCSRDARRRVPARSRRPIGGQRARGRAVAGGPVAGDARRDYDAAMDRIHEHIAAGDTYQVNMTIRLEARDSRRPPGPVPRSLLRAARRLRAPTSTRGRTASCRPRPSCSSGSTTDRIVTKPMKGTAPRGRWLAEDEAIRAGLEGSVKDRAENAMIVDLLRNDLGRVARSWVRHVERRVRRRTLRDRLAAHVDRRAPACGPRSGSSTSSARCSRADRSPGRPRSRRCGSSPRLEAAPRGVYCGTVGLPGAGRRGRPAARFNVAIRTVAAGRADRRGRSTGWAGGSRGTRAPTRSTTRRSRRRASSPPAGRPSGSSRRSPTSRAPGTAASRSTWRGCAPRPRTSATTLDEDDDPRGARPGGSVASRRPARVRLVVDRRGRVESRIGAPRQTLEPVRLALDRADPVDPADPMLFHKTTARARYDAARAIGSRTRTTSCW